MRILAIRGQNLASLKSFEVPLEELDAAGGLFAITGPTGAGKSTVLDALCLALYDKTPRLSARSTTPVSRTLDDELQISTTDVRNILRRGASQGFAEVDFVGQDGGHYRARWSVHRSRGRADGKLQSQKIELTELPDGLVRTSDTKTKTLEIIEEKVGLSFDQFRRSVLLAQGEFDAFLRAPTDERSKLLERMTGTDVYRRLSIGAHQRERAARDALERLRLRVADRPVLTADQRARLDAELVSAQDWAQACRGRQEVVAQNLRWYAELHRRAALLGEAVDRHAAATAAVEAAAPRRAALAAVVAAEPLRAPLDAATRRAEAHQKRLAEARQAQAAVERAERDRQEGQQLEAEAVADLEAARRAEESMRPALAEARRLDAELVPAGRAREAEFRRAQAALEAAQVAERALGEARAALGRAEAERTQAEAWLADRPAVAALGEAWSRWELELRRWSEALTAEREARRRVQAAHEAERAAAAEATEIQARFAAAEAAWQAAQAERAAAREAADAEPVGSARLGLEHLAQVREGLSRLEHLAEQARRGEAERHKLAERAREASSRAIFTEARAETLEAELRAERAHLAEARRSLETTRAVLSLADHRSHLVDGEPCPLCGAREHPGVAAASSAVELAHADRVRKLEHAVSEAERVLGQTRAEIESARQQARRDEEDAHKLQAELAGLAGSWEVATMAANELDPPKNVHDPATSTVLAQCRADLEARAEAATARVREAEHRETRARQAEQAAERARGAYDTAQAERHGAEQRRQAAAAARALAEAALAPARATRLDAEAQLTPVLGDAQWIDAAEHDPPAFLRRCERSVAEWRQVRDRCDRARAEAERQTAEVARRTEAAEAARAAARERDIERASADTYYQRLATERAALLGGEAVETVALRLEAAVQARRTALEEAKTARTADEVALAEARTRVEGARRQAEEAEAAAAEAAQRLQAALLAADLDEATLRARLDHPQGWREAETAALNALERAQHEAAARLEARRTDVAAHAADQPAPTEEALQAEQARLRAAAEALNRKVLDLQVKQQQDDAGHRARAGLAAELAAAEALHARWRELDTLIGSADGKSFSHFAQSLTLEAVLTHANRHLDELYRRYQLMRVPGEDLALQIIDRELGDDVRSLQSLSGGETFLVSLALALGLASLVSSSDRDLRIDSLFIDEGFGTLDPDTLDAVIETLETLQQTGRQVGIISHVPGLDERIGVQVKVVPKSAGLSEITIVGAR